MTTPEGKVKEQVKKILRLHNVYWHCPVQNGMGAPSLDFICCINGKYLAIETKAQGKGLTPRQQETAERIRRAGGQVLVVMNVDDLSLLETTLQLMEK